MELALWLTGLHCALMPFEGAPLYAHLYPSPCIPPTPPWFVSSSSQPARPFSRCHSAFLHFCDGCFVRCKHLNTADKISSAFSWLLNSFPIMHQPAPPSSTNTCNRLISLSKPWCRRSHPLSLLSLTLSRFHPLPSAEQQVKSTSMPQKLI